MATAFKHENAVVEGNEKFPLFPARNSHEGVWLALLLAGHAHNVFDIPKLLNGSSNPASALRKKGWPIRSPLFHIVGKPSRKGYSFYHFDRDQLKLWKANPILGKRIKSFLRSKK